MVYDRPQSRTLRAVIDRPYNSKRGFRFSIVSSCNAQELNSYNLPRREIGGERPPKFPRFTCSYTRILFMNLPNGLTLMRIFLVPLLVAVLLTKYNVLIAAAIFLAASLTDLLDGYFARKRGHGTARIWVDTH